MNDLSNGFKLGGVLLGLFFVSAAALYFVAGLVVNNSTNQLLLALCLGPLVGSVIFGIWWRSQRQPGGQEIAGNE